jgi:hypothetical protein
MKRVRGVHCTPKNVDVPPKMKVKGYMYPQMKKTVGMLVFQIFIRDSKLYFSKCKTDIDSSRSWRLARGKPVRLRKFEINIHV